MGAPERKTEGDKFLEIVRAARSQKLLEEFQRLIENPDEDTLWKTNVISTEIIIRCISGKEYN